jgi:hypothetical protein
MPSLSEKTYCGSYSVERALHAIFDTRRTSGEWFDITEHDASCVLNPLFRQEHGIV